MRRPCTRLGHLEPGTTLASRLLPDPARAARHGNTCASISMQARSRPPAPSMGVELEQDADVATLVISKAIKGQGKTRYRWAANKRALTHARLDTSAASHWLYRASAPLDNHPSSSGHTRRRQPHSLESPSASVPNHSQLSPSKFTKTTRLINISLLRASSTCFLQTTLNHHCPLFDPPLTSACAAGESGPYHGLE